jgi:lysyl-tRNA synthetase class 2
MKSTLSVARWRHNNSPASFLCGQIELSSQQDFANGHFFLRGQGMVLRVRARGVTTAGEPLPTSGSYVKLELNEFCVTADELVIDGPVRLEVLAPWRSGMVSVSSSPQLQKQWFTFLADIADICSGAGLLRVTTPSLVESPGLEPSLEPIAVRYQQSGTSWRSCFLPTSPEFSLKKLLACGYTDFFEIRSCFRAAECSSHHQAEFTMLEWYRAFANGEALIADVTTFFTELRHRGWFQLENFKPQVRTMAQVFASQLDFELTPQTTLLQLQKELTKNDLRWSPQWDWNDCFHLLFLEKIEPHLGQESPEIITHFPPSQAALAQLTADGWADRLELYWRGLEIANGYNELTDPHIQKQRFERDLLERRRRGQMDVPVDQEFMRSLEAGIPPTAGMAVGVERLFMACQEIKNIHELRLFPDAD